MGYASVKPDLIVLNIDLVTKRYSYDETLEKASEDSQILADAIGQTIEKDRVKTTDFQINTDYDSRRSKNGNYESIFKGYKLKQSFRIEFELDFKKLSKMLSAISESSLVPRFDIKFSVSDTTDVSEELLRSATQNARKKAEILADASGVKLGDIIDITYSWSRLDVYSHTDYRIYEAATPMSREVDAYIVPEDIDVQDNVTFVWSIK